MSTDLESGSILSLQGDSLPINLSNGVMVGDAMVIEADIPATNGTIHAIDTVMLPEGVLAGEEAPMPDGMMMPEDGVPEGMTTPEEITSPEEMTLPEEAPMPEGMMMPEESTSEDSTP